MSLATCLPGFPGVVLIPPGRLPTSPIPLLARVALLFQHPHPRTGDIHGRPKRRAQDASPAQQANQAQDASPAQEIAREVASRPRPRFGGGAACHQPGRGRIDVHSDMHMVCVPAERDANPVRQFGANTADLQEIVAWLKQCRIKTVALESTGVYWIALFELLEAEGFEVYLVEPGQLSRCGASQDGRARRAVDPTLAFLRSLAGLVSAAGFRAGLRAFWRQRQMQVRYAASHAQHMQKAMEQINVKLTEVVSDITGVTGMSIIGAILEGQRDPVKLAQLRDQRCQSSEDQIALALEGTWRPEHLFELRQAYELYQFHHRQITECDQQIEAELANFPNRAGAKTHTVKPRKRRRKSNDVRFDATGPLFQALGVDLTLIDGIDVATALVILGEIGVDVSRFPTEKHFASGCAVSAAG